WHEVQETASGCPVPAFHANFSHKNPLTRSAPRLKKKSPRGPCTQNCIIPPRPHGATVFSNLDDDPISSDPTNPPVGQSGQSSRSGCGKPANQTSFTHTTA